LPASGNPRIAIGASLPHTGHLGRREEPPMADLHQMPNRRGTDRQEVVFKTSLKVGDISTTCEIRDISIGGARVKAAVAAAPQTPIVLVIDQLGDYQARVAWVRRGEIGLKFDEPPERIGTALELIATYGQR